MSGPTCATCTHWSPGAQASMYPTTADAAYGNCEAIPSADGHRFDYPDALAFADSSEGIGGAWLQTRAEFGCVLHTAKADR